MLFGTHGAGSFGRYSLLWESSWSRIESLLSKAHMDSVGERRCPDCGALVPLPTDVLDASKYPDKRHLDQVTRALCGCWVARLPDGRALGLASAIMAGDEACDKQGTPRSSRGL